MHKLRIGSGARPFSAEIDESPNAWVRLATWPQRQISQALPLFRVAEWLPRPRRFARN